MTPGTTGASAAERDELARAVLRRNDRGGYTLPTHGLYPYQWNWDSAFVALGFSDFDIDRAWTEIESLMTHQWPNGMVPHIIFRRVDPDYFPGPEQWGNHRDPPTSGITQPPVVSIVARALYETDPDAGRDRAIAMLPALEAWHDWFHRARDPEGRGLVAIIHPWETGRDNLPDWDAPLSHVDTDGIGPYRRRDTRHVSAEQRPKQIDYDRYMALVRFGRNVSWSDPEIAASSPFWVADVGLNSILARAETDLADLADQLGDAGVAVRARERGERLAAGLQTLWSDELGGFVSLDLRRETAASSLSAGAFLPMFGGAASPAQADSLATVLHDWLGTVEFSVPSFDPRHALFDHLRYWRGPVWTIVNWMVADGFRRYGMLDQADRIRRDSRMLIEKSGFYENFSPLTGEGGGGSEFSWTAAMWLFWASPSAGPASDGETG